MFKNLIKIKNIYINNSCNNNIKMMIKIKITIIIYSIKYQRINKEI